MSTQSFAVPVVSFRHVETPVSAGGHRDYYAIVKASDLPNFSEWRKINVRDPRLRGIVPDKIRGGLENNPDLFVFMNRGLVVSAADVRYDNKKNVAVITLNDPNLHGLLDGGHSYNIIQEGASEADTTVHVKVEILTGFSRDEITDVVDARNTSNQVKDESLMNLQGEFSDLKKALSAQPYFNDIAWKEFETDDEGNPKPIDIREIISVLMCFDRTNFTDSVHPINAYRSKAAALTHFKDHKGDFKKLYPLADQFLRLHDEIALALPELYNKSRKNAGLSGGKFGNLTGVYKGKRKAKLAYTGKETEYGVPAGFIYPILGAFRALLVEKDGKFTWPGNVDPVAMLNNGLGLSLAQVLGNNALEVQNPSKTGKSLNLWQNLYTEARALSLELQLSQLRK